MSESMLTAARASAKNLSPISPTPLTLLLAISGEASNKNKKNYKKGVDKPLFFCYNVIKIKKGRKQAMKKFNYVITMENGSRYSVIGTSKTMVENELRLLNLPVVTIERVYKTGKLAECPW